MRTCSPAPRATGNARAGSGSGSGAEPCSAEQFLAPGPGWFHVRSRSALSGSPRRSAGLFFRLPCVGSPPTRPGHCAPGLSRPRPPGRTDACDPGWAADLSRQTGPPQGARKGGVPPPARAPPPKAQLRTSPPCAPSRGFALLPGKEKRSRFGHRLLKGQHRPSLILPNRAPPSPPNTCREPPKAWISPSPPLASRAASPPKQDGLDAWGPGWDLSGGFAAAATAAGKAVPGVATAARRWHIWEPTPARRWLKSPTRPHHTMSF